MLEETSANMDLSKKRSHDEAEGLLLPQVVVKGSEETRPLMPTSPSASETSPAPDRPLSPTISVESSALSEAQSMTYSASQATPPPAAGPLPAKKQKLTSAERDLQRALKQSAKDAMERRRAEEAQRKDQVKSAREDERRRREDEREKARIQRVLEKAEKQKARDAEREVKEELKQRKEEEKKAKDADKQAREDARRKREEEKNKKERSQLRLVSFFQKPAAGEESEGSCHASSRRSSVTSLPGVDDVEEAPTKISPLKKPDAKYGFLPFFVLKNVSMAPANRFSRDPNLANMAVSRLDGWMQQGSDPSPRQLKSVFRSRRRQRCQKQQCTMKDILESIQGTPAAAIDLTGKMPTVPQLSDVSYKVLSFREDVRPPYKGTYTRAVSPRSALKLSRRPFTRQLPDINYDYDSEAEWEPPNEDDEDLESGDDESDIGEEGDEDMDGFLDDEDDPGRKKQTVGEMTPISSGLCWTSADHRRGRLEEYRMQTLSDDHVFPIDPFSTAHWPKPQQIPKQPAMQPPRLPLSNLNPNRSPSMTPPSVNGETEQKADVLRQVPDSVKTQTAAAGKSLKLAPGEVLPAFKQAVEGSDLTKAGLVEVLKKQ